MVALSTGARLGEILGMTWDSVDLDAGRMTIRQALQRVDGVPHLLEPKTARSVRTVPLPRLAVSALREQRRRQLEERIAAGPAWEGERWNLVFMSLAGEPLEGTAVTKRFQTHLARAGLPRFRFHDLRHTAATLMLARSVSPRVVMETLGHSTITITMNVYAHVMPDQQRDAADRMDEALGF